MLRTEPGLGAAQAHSWDTGQDGDRHDRIGAEELPPSLQELKDTWLVTRQALDGGTQACLLKKTQPPTSALPPSPWNEAGSGQDTDSRLSSADSWLGYTAEVRMLRSFSSQTDFRTGKQSQNALPCNKYENT